MEWAEWMAARRERGLGGDAGGVQNMKEIIYDV